MKWAELVVLGCVFAVASTGVAQSKKEAEVAKLIKKLTAKSVEERVDACEEIGKIGEARAAFAVAAVDPLLKVLQKDSDAKVRTEAAVAIGKIDPDPKKAVPVLTKALSDSSDTVQLASIYALGYIGSGAKETLPQLRQIHDKHRALRDEAAGERTKLDKAGDMAKAQMAQARQQANNRYVQATDAAMKLINGQSE